MKKLAYVALAAVVMICVSGQAQSISLPRMGAFTWTGTAWAAASSTGTGPAAWQTPDPIALYCFNTGSGTWVPADSSCFGGGSMVYPGAGIPNSTGTAWGSSYGTTGTGSVVLSANPTFNGNGAASTSALVDNGTWFTSGTGTTAYPHWLIQPSGTTAVTTWNTLGTGFAINAPSGFNGFFLDFHVNGGASLFRVQSDGTAVSSNGINAASSINLSSNTAGMSSSAMRVANSSGYLFSSTTSYLGTADAGIDRSAAGILEVNNGTVGNSSGILKTVGLVSGGTKFTATGCTSITSTVGGATSGKFTVGANSCTVTITMNGATGMTAPNGYSCHANDETTTAGNSGLYFSANSTTTATLTVPAGAVASDVIDFGCIAY